MAVLLPPALFRFSSLHLRIEKPYTQWVRIANPDQRHDTNIRWVGPTARTSAGLGCKSRPAARDEQPRGRNQRHGMEHPIGRKHLLGRDVHTFNANYH